MCSHVTTVLLVVLKAFFCMVVYGENAFFGLHMFYCSTLIVHWGDKGMLPNVRHEPIMQVPPAPHLTALRATAGAAAAVVLSDLLCID